MSLLASPIGHDGVVHPRAPTAEDGPAAPLARIEALGHGAIRATHDASFELAQDDSITPRATCVIGVGARVVSGRVDALVGPVRVTIRLAGHPEAVVVDGVGNPGFVDGGGIVFRASPNRLPDTAVTDASLTAAGLDRGLAAAMADAGARVDVDIDRRDRRADGTTTVVLARDSGARRADHEVGAWMAIGHAVWATDAPAARRCAEMGGEVTYRGPGALASVGNLGAGAMPGVLVVLTVDDSPGRFVPAVIAALGADTPIAWEIAGLDPQLGLACVIGGNTPVVLGSAHSGKGGVEAAVARAGRDARVVVPADPDLAVALLDRLAGSDRDVPRSRFAAMLEWQGAGRRIVCGSAAVVAEAVQGSRSEVLLAAGPATAGPATAGPATAGPATVGPASGSSSPPVGVHIDSGVVEALLGSGVAVRTIVDALASRPGVRRNAARTWVQGLASDGDRDGAYDRP